MKNLCAKRKLFFMVPVMLMLLLIHSRVSVARAEAGNARLDVVVSNAEIAQILKKITAKQGMALEVDPSVSGRVSLSLYNKTISEILEELGRQASLEYVIVDGILRVKKTNSTTKSFAVEMDRPASQQERAPANDPTVSGMGEGVTPSESQGIVNLGNNVWMVKLGFANALDLAGKLSSIFGKDAQVVPDQRTNSILVAPSGASFKNIVKVIKAYDRIPDQVLIEAQIIETSSNFVQQMGVSWGNLSQTSSNSAAMNSLSKGNSFSIKNPGISNANVNLGVVFGSIDHQKLLAMLQIAESEGNAKIISRPKVVTADRLKAIIESGISYNIKTLSSVPSGGANTGTGASQSGTLTGGLQTVSAGLNLNVTPEIVGSELIRLEIDISSSEADLGNSVDGIPGVVRSAAKTSLIVKEGVTATIGGLVKYSQSNSDTGVPYLRNIPLLGWLFKSAQKQKNNSELLIFITPRIMERVDTHAASRGP